MNRSPYIMIAIIGNILILLAFLFGLARAQSPDCPGAALVQVIPGATLNVRAQPGGLSQILGTVNHESGELKVTEERNGFLRLETGGWIVNKYLSVACWGLGTPMAVTAVPSATLTPPATQTPLPTPRATPTRIAVQVIYCASQPSVTEIEPGLWRAMCEYR